MQAIPGLPEIRPGDDLAGALAAALRRSGLTLEVGDILVLAHKIVSKAEGRLVKLSTVTPSDRARELGRALNKDPRKVEVILRESERVLRAEKKADHEQGVLICRHRMGFTSANAAVDESNIPEAETVALLPEDPDASARRIRAGLRELTGVAIGLLISDTFGRPWRVGLVNVAIGLAGVPACLDWRGQPDAYGRPLQVTRPAFADEVAAAAGLLMGKRAMTPAILVRGLAWTEASGSARELVRPEEEDLFK
jgi:coenzyme F420-0:L-glutamate ligase/coenzyme F420-1:gamma-L-glutamate ligase